MFSPSSIVRQRDYTKTTERIGMKLGWRMGFVIDDRMDKRTCDDFLNVAKWDRFYACSVFSQVIIWILLKRLRRI